MKRNKDLHLIISEGESIANEALEAQQEEARLKGEGNPEDAKDFLFENALFVHEAYCKRNNIDFKRPANGN